ncbi:hypothetical protein BgiBS90_009985 [Biomphalaria glabrata]|nr:hypothetical protein BgiBS90_009985 [Biomphalaria glabrata]
MKLGKVRFMCIPLRAQWCSYIQDCSCQMYHSELSGVPIFKTVHVRCTTQSSVVFLYSRLFMSDVPLRAQWCSYIQDCSCQMYHSELSGVPIFKTVHVRCTTQSSVVFLYSRLFMSDVPLRAPSTHNHSTVVN